MVEQQRLQPWRHDESVRRKLSERTSMFHVHELDQIVHEAAVEVEIDVCPPLASQGEAAALVRSPVAGSRLETAPSTVVPTRESL